MTTLLLLLYLADSSSERIWDVTSSRKPSFASVMGSSCVQVHIPPLVYLEDQSYILLLQFFAETIFLYPPGKSLLR